MVQDSISQAEGLPDVTEAVFKLPNTNYHSDRYLFQAALRTESKTILTTDIRLRNAMRDDPHFRVMLLDEFLTDY